MPTGAKNTSLRFATSPGGPCRASRQRRSQATPETCDPEREAPQEDSGGNEFDDHSADSSSDIELAKSTLRELGAPVSDNATQWCAIIPNHNLEQP